MDMKHASPTTTVEPGMLSDQDRAEILAEIEKGQQLAGHFPNDEALDRASRILSGDITVDEAYAELDAKYASS